MQMPRATDGKSFPIRVRTLESSGLPLKQTVRQIDMVWVLTTAHVDHPQLNNARSALMSERAERRQPYWK